MSTDFSAKFVKSILSQALKDLLDQTISPYFSHHASTKSQLSLFW